MSDLRRREELKTIRQTGAPPQPEPIEIEEEVKKKPVSVPKPPLIEECYGHLECRVVQTHICGDHTLFVGEVVAASADEEVIKDWRLILAKAKPIIQKNWEYNTLGMP